MGQVITPISFGYKWAVKNLYNQGMLPTVKKDIYGKPIAQATVEHIIPKSKGGKSSQANYAIANAYENMKRGSDPLLKHTTKKNIKEYLEQFTDVIVGNFDGNRYKKDLTKTLRKINIDI